MLTNKHFPTIPHMNKIGEKTSNKIIFSAKKKSKNKFFWKNPKYTFTKGKLYKKNAKRFNSRKLFRFII